jgi:hypothetical protein
MIRAFFLDAEAETYAHLERCNAIGMLHGTRHDAKMRRWINYFFQTEKFTLTAQMLRC